MNQLTDQEMAAINAVTSYGNDVGQMLEQVSAFPGVDMRWLAVARTHLQEGFMFVKRAIARPGGF